ncbi:MAG TPA: hypothetical protein VMY37_31745 [Thermoguttaceae bacterium]|nr:hypothetical protein [Thermoguttaceae bacterium]
MTQRIAYLSWPPNEISGGIKMAFAHVEALREAGWEAVIATPGAGMPTWFESDAPVIDTSELVADQDILVFPENHHRFLKSLASWPNRKLVFCQNQFMVHRGLKGSRDYADFGVRGILCVGRHALDFCRRRFPSQPISSVPVFIDHDLFCFQPQKRLQIAFTPRKRPLEAAFIQDLFRAENPGFRDIPWVQISGVPTRTVAQILKESAIYLSLCRFECVPLTALEALACGCVTAGFTGFGAREYTTAKNGFWATEDDCLDCVTQLTRAVRTVTAGGPSHSEMLEAAHISASYYSRQRFASRLVEFWRVYLSDKGSSG